MNARIANGYPTAYRGGPHVGFQSGSGKLGYAEFSRIMSQPFQGRTGRWMDDIMSQPFTPRSSRPGWRYSSKAFTGLPHVAGLRGVVRPAQFSAGLMRAASIFGAVPTPLSWYDAWEYLVEDPHGLIAPGVTWRETPAEVGVPSDWTADGACDPGPVHAIGKALFGPDRCTKWLVVEGETWPAGVPELDPDDTSAQTYEREPAGFPYEYRIDPNERYSLPAGKTWSDYSSKAVRFGALAVPLSQAVRFAPREREVGPREAKAPKTQTNARRLTPRGPGDVYVLTGRPGRGVKEAKLTFRSALLYGLVARAFGELTEFGDAVDALYGALPEHRKFSQQGLFRQRRRSGARSRFQTVVDNFGEIDWDQAVINLATNELQDRAIGRLARGGQVGFGRQFNIGLTVGPAL